MKIQDSREALFSLMVNSKIVKIDGFTGIIQSIQMEDGSGNCFNVSIRNPLETRTVFVRCSTKPTILA
jgi:hypothetical protein